MWTDQSVVLWTGSDTITIHGTFKRNGSLCKTLIKYKYGINMSYIISHYIYENSISEIMV